MNMKILCLFCNEKISEYKPRTIQKCCETPNLIIDKGEVCTNCGIIDFNYKCISPYINFYDIKFRTKTIYNPKYWIIRKINSYGIKQVTYNTQDKILRICKEIYKIKDTTRIISINYIIRCLFRKMKIIFYKSIPLPKSQKTRIYYKRWWKRIIRLIGGKINNIIQK